MRCGGKHCVSSQRTRSKRFIRRYTMSRHLADIQQEFAQALLASAAPAGRLAIYHNNYRANFIKALTLGYPVIARIVGSDFFASLARRFLEQYPSRSGDLHHVGKDFAEFLATDFAAPGSAFEYLADLARLEWAWARALLAADKPALSVDALARHPPAEWPALHFELQPSSTLIASRFPVHTLFDEHRKTLPAITRLDAGSECVAVLRRAHQVAAHRLSAREYTLWQSLRDGLPLETALETALENAHEPESRTEFDLSAALGRLFAAGAVSALGS
ncbi:MAG: DUF2063 domain-containing protein [Gammaproteobacteria bacterium]|nr:DUF2063 domain-containing protein [Gammaproteobacteria bacterium]